MTIGFTSPNYEASEADGGSQVCVNLSGRTERRVSFTLEVIGGLATG